MMEKKISGPHGVTAAQPREQLHSGPAEGPLLKKRPSQPRRKHSSQGCRHMFSAFVQRLIDVM